MTLRHRLHHGARSSLASRRRARAGARGQTLVEFALVFPMFLTLLVGLIEFAFVFNAILSVQFATQNAALMAAEIGDMPGVSGSLSVADCAILRAVERDVIAPAHASQIGSVKIIWADGLTGVSKGSGTTTTTAYTRTATSNCTFPDGTTGTVPYAAPSPNNYPPAARCNFLVPSVTHCPPTAGISHTGGPDFIAVEITYTHAFMTPIGGFIPATGGVLTFTRSNAVRMEPIL